MAIIVVGGHTRNIGKTSVVCELVAAMPEMRWTAMKITQFGHGVCSANGEPCNCETADHTIAVSEERQLGTGTDTSRYLDAGAERSFWVRTRQGQLHEAMPKVRSLLAGTENAILESNSILRFLQPTFAVSVLDRHQTDFKASAAQHLDRYDAFILSGDNNEKGSWPGVSEALLARRPAFTSVPPAYCSPQLLSLVRERLQTADAHQR